MLGVHQKYFISLRIMAIMFCDRSFHSINSASFPNCELIHQNMKQLVRVVDGQIGSTSTTSVSDAIMSRISIITMYIESMYKSQKGKNPTDPKIVASL